MLDLGWSELLVVAVIALIVVGPKELPALLRTIGKVLKALRSQANEFRSHFDNAMKDTGLEEVRSEFQQLKSDAVDTVRGAQREFEKEIDSVNEAGREINRELNKEDADDAAEKSSVHGKGKDSEDAWVDDEWAEEYNKSILEAEKRADIDQDDAAGGVPNDHNTEIVKSDTATGARAVDEDARKVEAAT